jgi:ABC-type tungstate transport system substrate-binding protein
MDYIIEAFLGAFRFILSLDRKIFTIALFSLQVAGTAAAFATVIGVPLAYAMATQDFRGNASY